ncbi:ISAs1 family transposase [Paraburkholderia aspalathi]|uniref:ISAs1 family transposase n=1 Tax=Paraburkholderia aspalathi TaxID=1324617 RepID=UPI001B279C99|nr:hypothetical protein R20943_03906 [Paraburkholderia aspalathi]
MRENVLSIEGAFGNLRDPRIRMAVHDLTEILVVALCAILSGTDSWVEIQTWAEAKLDWLRRYLPLVNGIASHDTFGSIFAALDAQQFEACFVRWTAHLCPALADQVVDLDGKTIRGSHRGGQRALACLVRGIFAALERWPGLRSVVMVEATREISGVASTERCYYIRSLPANANRISHAIRSHRYVPPRGLPFGALRRARTGCSTWSLAKTTAA